MIRIEVTLFAAAVLVLISIFASRISLRFGIPALLLFLLVGMVAGSEGIGGVYYDDPYSAQFIGTVALAFILFSGGLDSQWARLRPALVPSILLSSVGVILTAVLVGVFSHLVFGFTLTEGILLGAIVSSTDAAAVFSVLRGQKIRLYGSLEPILELESGSNDPMAILLTLGMIQVITVPSITFLDLLIFFVQQFVLGALMGVASAFTLRWLLNRARLEVDGLYPVFMFAFVLLTYGLTASIGGNGFLAVFLSGIILAQFEFRHKRSLISFHEGIAWLMQITMFLALGLLVFPSQVLAQADKGILIALFLIIVARPAAVFISLIFLRIPWRQMLFVAWVGLRGAAPIILATFPLLAGIALAAEIFNIVFFVVVTSVILQGLSLVWVARKLGLYIDAPPDVKSPLVFVQGDDMRGALHEIVVEANSGAVGRKILELSLPPSTLIVLIGRNNEFIVPNGGTDILPGDRLLVLSDAQHLPALTTLCQC